MSEQTEATEPVVLTLKLQICLAIFFMAPPGSIPAFILFLHLYEHFNTLLLSRPCASNNSQLWLMLLYTDNDDGGTDFATLSHYHAFWCGVFINGCTSVFEYSVIFKIEGLLLLQLLLLLFEYKCSNSKLACREMQAHHQFNLSRKVVLWMEVHICQKSAYMVCMNRSQWMSKMSTNLV